MKQKLGNREQCSKTVLATINISRVRNTQMWVYNECDVLPQEFTKYGHGLSRD